MTAVVWTYLLGICVVMLASDSVLMLSAWADRLLSTLGCVALVGASGAHWVRSGRGSAAVIAAIGGLALCACVVNPLIDGITRTILIAWLFGLLAVAESRCGRPGPCEERDPGSAVASALVVLHLASLIYALGCAFHRHSETVWQTLQAVSPGGLLPGPAVGGWVCCMPACGFGAAVLASAQLVAGRDSRREASCRLAGLAIVAAGCASGVVAVRLGVPTTHLTVSVTHAASLGLLAAVATWARPAHPSRGVWRFSLALSLAAVALAFRPGAANDSAAGVDTAGERPVTFAVYAAGLLDWRVPDSSAVGLHYAGMFGLFRRSLGRHAADTGGEVVLLESSAGPAITPGDLDQAAAAIFINPTRVPGAGEVECLRAYVEAGGGLLVLGDHTDIGGSRAALNAVLSFTGIRFNFDSAVPLRHNWQGCLEVRPHPITRRLGEPPGSELRAQLAVGASLAVTGPAKSLVLGRYAFADRGDSLNGGAAAFLGDLVRDRREAVGDVALVAAQQVGRGRVLVFGDTSPFQNGALFLSMDLVSDAVTWVCWPKARRYLDLAPYPEAAAVDFSLHPRARAALFADESLGGLANCLARLGMTARPVFARDQWDQAGSHLFVVAPSRMDGLDVELLLRYVDAGGNLVLCQGYAPSQPCRRLLAALGMRIACIPLGNGDGRFPIAHRDAWALECVTLPDEASPPAGGPQPGGGPIVAGADTTVLASAFGYPTVVSRPYGRGTATVVSDGGFLLDCNLEGERSANTLNIALLGRLLGRRQPSQVD